MSDDALPPAPTEPAHPPAGETDATVVESAAPPSSADDLDAYAAALATALVLERGAPSSWRAVPVRRSLGSAVIDAVMSPRVATSTVDAVVARHEAAFGAGTASELRHAFDLMGDAGWRREIGTGHRTSARLDAPHKSAAIAGAAALLAEHGIETTAALCAAAEDETLRRAWCALPGQSSGTTWRHLLLASGHDELLVCPLTRRFARRATDRTFSDSELVEVITATAARLHVAPQAVEHQMWRAASARPRTDMTEPPPSSEGGGSEATTDGAGSSPNPSESDPGHLMLTSDLW